VELTDHPGAGAVSEAILAGTRNGADPRPSAFRGIGLPVRVIRSKRGWMLSCVRAGGWLAPLLSLWLSLVPSSVVTARCSDRTNGARSLARRASRCQVEADYYKTECLRIGYDSFHPSFAEAKVVAAGVSRQRKKRYHSREKKVQAQRCWDLKGKCQDDERRISQHERDSCA